MTLGCVMTVLRISEVISADRRLCNFDCQGIGERCSGFQPLKIAAIQKFKVQPFEDKRILGRVRLSRVNKSPDGRSKVRPQSRNLLANDLRLRLSHFEIPPSLMTSSRSVSSMSCAALIGGSFFAQYGQSRQAIDIRLPGFFHPG